VLQIFRSVVDDPVARCARPPAPHHHLVRPDRPSSIVAPNRNSTKTSDLTIVRPAAAAPPRRLAQVGLRHSSESAIRARVTTAKMVNADPLNEVV
jgi:hypothetical protein